VVARAVRRVNDARKRNYLEELAVRSDSGLSTLGERRKSLLLTLVCGLIATALVWIVALVFPNFAFNLLENEVITNSKLASILLMLVPFAPPFVSSFALSSLLFTTPPGPDTVTGVMSSFEYREKQAKKSLLIVASAILGGFNCLLIFWVVAEASGH
jgi:hypothetical protein